MESMGQITLDELNRWYDQIRRYRPYFGAVGLNITDQMVEENGLSGLFSIFGNKSENSNPITPPTRKLAKKDDKPQMESSNAYIGVNLRGSDPSSENMYAEDLFRAVISGGVSARMFSEIREKRNLSYAPRLVPSKFTNGSLYTALMDVRPDRSVEALQTTANIFYDVMNNPIDEGEMRRALKVAQKIAVFVSDYSPSYIDFLLNRLVTNQDYDLDLIKRKYEAEAKSDWQSKVKPLWIPENISLAVSGDAGEAPNVWEQTMEKLM
jgi:predicted Zn-dependent peptidase